MRLGIEKNNASVAPVSAADFARSSPLVAGRELSAFRRRSLVCLGFGLSLHLAFALLSRSPGESTVPEAAAPPRQETIEIVQEARRAGEAGGTPGPEQVVGPKVSARTGTPRPVRFAESRAPETPKPAPPAAGALEKAEEPQVAEDLLAVADELGEFSQAALPVAGLAARTKVLALEAGRSQGATRIGSSGNDAQGNLAPGLSNAGSGGGRGTGSGGPGGFTFGGTSGAFLAQVCFIPKYTLSVAAVGSCEVQGEFRTDEINVSPRKFTEGFPGISTRNEWFAILYSGNFQVSKSGLHRFRLISDDGSYLVIDGQRVLDNDGIHGPVSKGVVLDMEPGQHRFELHYFQGPREMVAIQLLVTPPDGKERPLTERL